MTTPNPTLKEQVEEILKQHGSDEGGRPSACKRNLCGHASALLALFTADRKAHELAMLEAVPFHEEKEFYARECGDDCCGGYSHNERLRKENEIRQALIQASARYQEGEGV